MPEPGAIANWGSFPRDCWFRLQLFDSFLITYWLTQAFKGDFLHKSRCYQLPCPGFHSSLETVRLRMRAFFGLDVYMGRMIRITMRTDVLSSVYTGHIFGYRRTHDISKNNDSVYRVNIFMTQVDTFVAACCKSSEMQLFGYMCQNVSEFSPIRDQLWSADNNLLQKYISTN